MLSIWIIGEEREFNPPGRGLFVQFPREISFRKVLGLSINLDALSFSPFLYTLGF